MRTLKITGEPSGSVCGILTETTGDAPVLMTSVATALALNWARKSSHCFNSSELNGWPAAPAKKPGEVIARAAKTIGNSSVPGFLSGSIKCSLGGLKWTPLFTSLVVTPYHSGGLAVRKGV